MKTIFSFVIPDLTIETLFIAARTVTLLIFGVLAVCSYGYAEKAGASDPLSGNWRISLPKENDTGRVGYLSIHRPGEIGCLPQEEGGCIYRWLFEDGPERLVPVNGGVKSARRLSFHFKVSADLVTSDRIELTRGSSAMTHSVELVQTSDELFEGVWTRGNNSGAEIWERIEPTINSISILPIGADAGDAQGPFSIDDVIPMVSQQKYDPFWWGEDAKLKANRPNFTIYFYGEDLWGFHQIEGVDAVDFEVSKPRNIRLEPNDEGRRIIVGQQVTVYLWKEATPGLKRFSINGTEFMVNVEIPGFPEEEVEEPLPTLDFSFTGWKSEADLPVLDFSFEGWKSETPLPDLSFSFTGLGAGDTLPDVSLSFKGWHSDPADVPITLSFRGTGNE